MLCQRKGRECKKCHKPKPLSCYLQENTICTACSKRNISGKNNKTQVGMGGAAIVTEIAPQLFLNGDPMETLLASHANARLHLESSINRNRGVKWYVTLYVLLSRSEADGEIIEIDVPFRSKNFILLNMYDFDDQYSSAMDDVMNRISIFLREGSGWIVQEVISLKLYTAVYHPLAGSSYIPTPPFLAQKKAIINVRNEDNECFRWAVLSALHPCDKNTERIVNYISYYDELKFNDMSFPFDKKNIRKFENANNISINLFGFEEEDNEIYPLQITERRGDQNVINLMLLNEGYTNHYVWIKNFSRLMGHTRAKGCHHYCPYCLHGFYKKETLDNHLPYCSTNGPQVVNMSKKDVLKFNDYANMQKVPYVFYADFECILEKVEPTNSESKTIEYEEHKPCGFAYIKVSSNPSETFQPVVSIIITQVFRLNHNNINNNYIS